MFTKKLHAACKRAALVATVVVGMAATSPPALANGSGNAPTAGNVEINSTNLSVNVNPSGDNEGNSSADNTGNY